VLLKELVLEVHREMLPLESPAIVLAEGEARFAEQVQEFYRL
jgi:hypothetical protein